MVLARNGVFIRFTMFRWSHNADRSLWLKGGAGRGISASLARLTNKVAALVFLALWSVPQHARSEGERPHSIEISASQLTAMTTALDRFRSEGNKIDDYYALVVAGKDGTEVIFVPELVKSSNMVSFEKSSKHEIHYYLDVTGLRVIKVLLGQ